MHMHTRTYFTNFYTLPPSPHPWCFCFAMVVRLERFTDTKNYARCNTATSRVSKAGQVMSGDPGKERHAGPQGWGY